ncbi:MAG: hypothetical protein H7Y11_10575 [Armatimonadetes bacterium]|nr:hypothetical protein [Anaerolineae bacterium]
MILNPKPTLNNLTIDDLRVLVQTTVRELLAEERQQLPGNEDFTVNTQPQAGLLTLAPINIGALHPDFILISRAEYYDD